MFDVIIIGGGLAGASLANALASASLLRIAIIEPFPPKSNSQPSFDDRSVALSYQSVALLKDWDVWHNVSQFEYINKIHVSDQGKFAKVKMEGTDYGLPFLGSVVQNRVLGKALWAGLDSHSNVEVFCPANAISVESGKECASVRVECGGEVLSLEAKLVIGADGQQSIVRKAIGAKTQSWSYGQAGIIANIQYELPHNGVAYERFTSKGPLAMLPLTENSMSMVMSIGADEQRSVMGLSDEAFADLVQKQFGWYLGKVLKVGHRVCYPLKLTRASFETNKQLLLVGNAAHTLHPIAGQGLNLTLRDLATLSDLLSGGQDSAADIESILKKYSALRRADQAKVTYGTDFLNRLFSTEFLPSVAGRQVIMHLVEHIPPLKSSLMQQALGLKWS